MLRAFVKLDVCEPGSADNGDCSFGSFSVGEQHDQSQHAPENEYRPNGNAPAGLLYVFVHENPCDPRRPRLPQDPNMAALRHEI